MQQLKEPVAFLVLGNENSMFCELKTLLDESYLRERNCILNLCCDIEKIKHFIHKLEQNIVKVSNNCIILDGKLPEELVKGLVTALKNSPAFVSLPIVVLADCDNIALTQFCYSHYVTAVIPQPADEQGFKQCMMEIIDYWVNIAMLPPYAIIRERNLFG